MKMCVGGDWVETDKSMEVIHPFDGSVVDTVPVAGPAEVERALARASEGARVMARMPAWERAQVLRRVADSIEREAETWARTITLEEGKPIQEARVEVARAVETLRLSAEESRRIHGETVPLDAVPAGVGRFGFTLRVPCGVVVAISPFNFPLNLCVHKVGPALAAGNAVIIKPPSNTPLSALRLTERLLECGVPGPAISCLTGPGGEVGEALCRDARVRKISFTGSREVGERICRVAGLKRVTMELGSNSPIVVMADANLEKVASAVAATGFTNAGQVCISTQRVFAERPVYDELLERSRSLVEALPVGNPLAEETRVGPMIREREAQRVEHWVREAVEGGARLVTGGVREGAVYRPTIVADARPSMRVMCEELFGPAVAFMAVDSVEDALRLANESRYGLAASVFTERVDVALRFARELEAGNIHVNWGPQWRADLMPYGGLKESGFGKEGPRYAVEEMTELKMVVIHP